MLENGIIEQSFSPFSSPVTLVTKRDKTKRFCIDYRKVNELISSDVHPLPRIEDILDSLARAKYFSTTDISSAYWQVPIHPDSRPLLAFATLEGLYQPTRLPFGLKTSPQIYERAMSQVLQRHRLDCVAHYFDYFIIFSNTLEEHQNHLQLNFAKCEFFKQSINFLGYTITAGTTTPLTRNTDIIHAIQQPHNRKTLQSFQGAVNVYNKFIPEYARLRTPLNNLLKRDVMWLWDEKCQKAFISLKESLTQHPILHHYKEGLPCQVYCDATTLGIAGILKQVHPDGKIYPVQYFSRTLRSHERNYSISELECLAIVESVEKFRIYLMGRKFTIFSDHHALQWLKTIKNPSGRLFRWSLRLSSYEYEVRYIKGKQQYEADLLSRNPFCGFLDASLIKNHQSSPSGDSSLTIDHNGLHTVSLKGVTKIIIPKILIHKLLQTVHTQYNHPGISQMTRLISTQYYWQGMSKDITQKVKTCPTCQLTKRPLGPTYGELGQPPEAKGPFDLLSLDTIAGFAKYGNTKIYLHVVVDHFSRYTWTFPSKSTSITTYQQVLKRVLQDGSSKRLLTDRAPAFTSPKFKSFLLNRSIHSLLTTSNNPQANGLCERLNATLTGKLRLLHLENPKIAWTKLVKRVTTIYNSTPHSITGFPPIYLMFGVLPPELSDHTIPYPDIDRARKIAHTRTQNKHIQDKNTYDQRHEQPHFEMGDLVLVKLYHHPNTAKLAPYFTGPYTILEITSPNFPGGTKESQIFIDFRSWNYRNLEDKHGNGCSSASAFQSVHDDDSISACVKFQYLQNCMIKGSVSEEIVSSFPNSAANYPLVISTLKERFGREDMLVEVYHKRYRIYISDVDSKYNCNFEVQDCSTICSSMPSAQPTEWMTELRSKGIDLDVYRSNTEIELLLGADVYAKLLTGKKIVLESGPVALETKLGWTCSFEGVKDKKFKNLRVYEDESGLLRVKCRFVPVEKVDAHSYPMVMPSNGVTGQLIWSYHRLMCHAGVQSLHENLRERYWILNSRRTIRNEIRPCARCRRFRAQPCYVEEGPLPKDRVRVGPAFDVTGVDMTGPLHLKGNKKYWIAIFTCATYRAIHLELCTSLTTETFIGAMRRFVARRGRPSTIYSDNGLNFVGCKNLFSSLDWNKIVEYGAITRISWKFNPPTACWWGGFWERMIGIVKQLLRSVLGSARVTNEELQTLLCDVEAVVNNRPLTYVSEDDDELAPLTPNKLINNCGSSILPEADEVERDSMVSRYRNMQACRDEHRARFTKEYLAMLVHHGKARKSRRIEWRRCYLGPMDKFESQE
ncbi:hypothetical protein LAZ67_8001340 [Cordylochernes scorpioides]|uniref:RNA-directed DNA polymerase n=1 Tax=Cordylochernes scorpioides TaxID=51811 RepID=A0ABY6KQM2_9ARAC|nr:hypothetical protein LAZ67_8001340 [Cordylochernes scorpioides]